MWQQHSSSRNLQKTHKCIAESLFINMCQSFDWSHMATLHILIWSSGRAMYIFIYFNPPIRIKTKTESKNLQPELFRGKYVWTHAHICDSRKSAGKTEGLQGERDQKLASTLLYLREYLLISCFCPGSCTLCVCLRGIFKEGGAHSSHFLLFYIVFMSTILNRDASMEIMFVFYSGFLVQKTKNIGSCNFISTEFPNITKNWKWQQR